MSIVLKYCFTLLLSLLGLTVFTFILSQQALEPLHSYTSSSSFGQYFEYISYLLQGNWGVSSRNNGDVLSDFFSHLPATLELLVFALFVAVTLGLGLGILAANKADKWVDNTIMSTTLISYSMPIFWWGMLLVLLFSLTLGWTPVAGRLDFVYDVEPVTGFMLIDTLMSYSTYGLSAFLDALHHLILPTLTLCMVPMTIIVRMTRSSLLQVMKSDYIRTARSKGLSQSHIIRKHALRNVIQPILMISSIQISIITTGVILTEYIFAWPGLGKWLLEAISRRDFATIQGGVLALSVIVIFFNLFLDVISSYFNPRLRRPK